MGLGSPLPGASRAKGQRVMPSCLLTGVLKDRLRVMSSGARPTRIPRTLWQSLSLRKSGFSLRFPWMNHTDLRVLGDVDPLSFADLFPVLVGVLEPVIPVLRLARGGVRLDWGVLLTPPAFVKLGWLGFSVGDDGLTPVRVQPDDGLGREVNVL